MSRTKRTPLPGKTGEWLPGFMEDVIRGLVAMPKRIPGTCSEIWRRKAKKFRKRTLVRKDRREIDFDFSE